MKAIIIIALLELVVVCVLAINNKVLRRRQHTLQILYWRQARRTSSVENKNCRLSIEKQDLNKQLAGLKLTLLSIGFQMRKRGIHKDNAQSELQISEERYDE